MEKSPKKRSCAKIAEALRLPKGKQGNAGKQQVFRQSRGLSPIPDDLKHEWVRISKGQVRLEDTINIPEGGRP